MTSTTIYVKTILIYYYPTLEILGGGLIVSSDSTRYVNTGDYNVWYPDLAVKTFTVNKTMTWTTPGSFISFEKTSGGADYPDLPDTYCWSTDKIRVAHT